MLGEKMAQSLLRREGRLFPSKTIDDTSSAAVSIDSEPIPGGREGDLKVSRTWIVSTPQLQVRKLKERLPNPARRREDSATYYPSP